MRVIYITRTYAKDSNAENCSGFRNYTVELLKKRYEVIVVTPDYSGDSIQDKDGIITIPITIRRIDSWLQRVGIYDDYLQRWANDSFEYLKDIVNPNDVIMAASGSELGCIMLAVRLKQRFGCKIIVNFHDPIAATIVNGKKSTLRLHVNRDRTLGKYLEKADGIITCSNTYKNILENKYGNRIVPIQNIYRGYRGSEEKVVHHNEHKPLHLVYAGTMTPTQGAERFIDLLSERDDVEIIYIGKASDLIIKKSSLHKNVKLVASMPHDQYIEYIKEEADIGLVALKGQEFGACVPSKIFELINLEIPIFAILPEGDASELINSGYGQSCSQDNKTEVNSKFEELIQSDTIESIKRKMHFEKMNWKTDILFDSVYKLIDELK